MLIRKRAVVAKIEAVEGTAETLGAADGGIQVYAPKIATAPNWFERDFVRTTLSRNPATHTTRPFQLTFGVELRGSGVVGTAPDWDKYLRACGFRVLPGGNPSVSPSASLSASPSATGSPSASASPSASRSPSASASPSVTPSASRSPSASLSPSASPSPGDFDFWYHPASDNIPSLTMALYDDGVVFKGKGCRGNVKIAGMLGQPVMLEFDFQGVLDSVVDGAAPAGIAYSQVVPVGMLGTNILAIHGYNPCFTSFDVDMGNAIALRECANNLQGILSALITGRDPKGTLDPEMTTVLTHDWYGKWTSGVLAQLDLELDGGVGNTINLNAPYVQYRELTDAERNGISVRTLGFALTGGAVGDDELSIRVG